MTIKTKIIVMTGCSLFLTAIAIGFLSVAQLNKTGNMAISQIEKMGRFEVERIRIDGKNEIKIYRNDLLSRKKEYLQSQIQTAIGVLEKGNKDAHDLAKIQDLYKAQLQNAINTVYSLIVNIDKNLGLTENEKQQKAMREIEALRYGPENKDYFWINDMHPKMVMHPYKPELNGKDLSESKDPNGKKLFVEFVKTCRAKGEGFVDYMWPKPGFDDSQPKLSFVKLFKKWGWVIGTGVYLEVAEQDLKTNSAAVIGALRFGPENKDYFWINDMHPKMVMHPYKPKLNGKDLSESKDPNGKKLFVEFVKTCRAKGEGFVDYMWPNPSEPPTYLLVQALQLLWLVNIHDSYKCLLMLTIVSYPNPSPRWSFQERFHLTASTPFAQANFGALSGRLHTRQGFTLSACFHRIAVTEHWVQTKAKCLR